MTPEYELLDSFVRRLRQEPDFLAHVLHTYMEQEHIGEDQLAAQLGIGADRLKRLGSCRTPRVASDHFGADVQRIAQFTGTNVTELARVIRTATAVAAIQQAPSPQQPEASASPGPLLRPGLLAAARDREADSEKAASDETPPSPLQNEEA